MAFIRHSLRGSAHRCWRQAQTPDYVLDIAYHTGKRQTREKPTGAEEAIEKRLLFGFSSTNELGAEQARRKNESGGRRYEAP
jgi:hypothetical protein